MDPEAAWAELIQSYSDGRRWTIAADLLEWLNKGGFPPKITGNQEFDRVAATAVCEHVLEGYPPTEEHR